MKLCDRCRVAGCLLNYGGKACKNARKQNCPDVVFTNADMVREMNDEELAKFMLSSNGAAYCKNNASNPCLFFGGSYVQSGNHGLFCVDYASASDSNADFGCRLQKLP